MKIASFIVIISLYNQTLPEVISWLFYLSIVTNKLAKFSLKTIQLYHLTNFVSQESEYCVRALCLGSQEVAVKVWPGCILT